MECKQACLLEEDLPAGCQFETTFALDSSEAGWDLHKSWNFHLLGVCKNLLCSTSMPVGLVRINFPFCKFFSPLRSRSSSLFVKILECRKRHLCFIAR